MYLLFCVEAIFLQCFGRLSRLFFIYILKFHFDWIWDAEEWKSGHCWLKGPITNLSYPSFALIIFFFIIWGYVHIRHPPQQICTNEKHFTIDRRVQWSSHPAWNAVPSTIFIRGIAGILILLPLVSKKFVFPHHPSVSSWCDPGQSQGRDTLPFQTGARSCRFRAADVLCSNSGSLADPVVTQL